MFQGAFHNQQPTDGCSLFRPLVIPQRSPKIPSLISGPHCFSSPASVAAAAAVAALGRAAAKAVVATIVATVVATVEEDDNVEVAAS